MGAIRTLLQDVTVPKMARIRQIFDDTHIAEQDISKVLR